MRRLIESNKLLLLLYGCLLVCLASYFVIQEHHLSYQLHHKLPLYFIARVGVFWFVSLMIAVVLYLAHLSYHNLFLKKPERVLARNAGYLIFWLGVAGGFLIFAVLCLFYQYPQYFYL